MKVPRGVLKPGEEGKVLRLLKGLYGLKRLVHGDDEGVHQGVWF